MSPLALALAQWFLYLAVCAFVSVFYLWWNIGRIGLSCAEFDQGTEPNPNRHRWFEPQGFAEITAEGWNCAIGIEPAIDLNKDYCSVWLPGEVR